MARKFIDLIMKIFPSLRLNSNARWSKMTTKFSLHLPIAWILDVQWDPRFMLSYSVSFSCSVCLFDFFNFWWSIFPKTRKWRFSKKQSSFPYPKGALECILEAYSIFLNSTHSQQDIKTTDQRPTDHWQLSHQPTDPTDPPTHWPNNHRPNNRIIFKRLDDWEIFILQNTNAAGKIKNTFPFIWHLFEQNQSLYNFKSL